MKKFKSSRKTVLPYALSVTKTSLQTVQTLSSLVHPPCVGPVVAAALQVIIMIDGMQSNKEECAALQKRIEDLAVVASKPWVGKRDEDILEDTRIMINSLRAALESTRTDLLEYTKACRLKRLLLYKDLGQTIKSCSVKLDFAMQLFQVEALIAADGKLDLKLDARFDALESKLEQLTINSTTAVPDVRTLNFSVVARPPKPDLFFGREDTVSEVAQRLISTQNARLAILGGGGIGKTSVACAVLADDHIIATFDGGLTWIPCTEASSLSLFVELLADSMNVPKQSQNRLSDVFAWLQSQIGRHLLVLDNFETPWDIEGHQADVERILSALVAVPQVSLLITMRARVPPSCTAGLKWSQPHLAPLSVLSLDAARQLYLEIDPTAVNDLSLDPLLLELDCVPLAVTLMAKVGLYGETPTALLSRWRSKTGGINVLDLGDDQLSSVQLSIELSINSNLMKRKPQAEKLLRVLAFLPGGARRDFLPELAPSISTMEAILPLMQTSLVSLDVPSQTFRVLSPIRIYMLQYHPVELEARCSLHEAYFNLLRDNPCTDDMLVESVRILSLEESNLEVILLDALPSGQERAIRAAIMFGRLQSCTRRRSEVVETCARVAEELGLLALLPYCLEILGEILLPDRCEEAVRALKRAHEAYELLGDISGVAACLWNLGDNARMRGRYDEAWSMLNQAQEAYERVENVKGAAVCLRARADMLFMRSQYDAAEVMLRQAQDAFERVGAVLGVAECLRSLGGVFIQRGQYETAESTLRQAQNVYERIGYVFGVAHCLLSLGWLSYWRGMHDEAEMTLTQAQDAYERVGEVSGVAECLRKRGEICRMRGQYDEAALMLTEGQRVFERLGDTLGVANCLWNLGNISIARGRYDEAESRLKRAQEGYERLGNADWAANCLKLLEPIPMARHGNAEKESSREV